MQEDDDEDEDNEAVAVAKAAAEAEEATKAKEETKKTKKKEKKKKKTTTKRKATTQQKEKIKSNAEESMDSDDEWLPAHEDAEEAMQEDDDEDLTGDAVGDAVEESDGDDGIDSENASPRLARWRNVKVDREIGARRAALADALKQAIESVAQAKIHPHQRAAAMLLIERFCSGSPETLFVMDCGLGKTHTMLLVAGALISSKVRVVLASENLLASECKKVFQELWPDLDLSELNVIVSGHQAVHQTNAAEAFAQREREDAVFILDEASRYSDETAAMYEAIADSATNGYQPFRILVTATPFTANFAKLGALLSLTGIVRDDERDEFKKNFALEARSFVNVVKKVQVHELPATELSEFCDELTVGRRALEDAAPRVVEELVNDLAVRVREDISVLTLPISQPQSFWTTLIATATTKCKHQVLDIVSKCELSDTLALRATRELELDPPRGEGMDASVNDIVQLICSMANEGGVVVYVPSDLASGAWYVWTRIIAVLGPGKCAIIDQDTKADERRRIIASFDAPIDQREYNVLFATTETAGFGINLPTVDQAILLTSTWTASTNAQATHRNVRAFANVVGPPRLKRLVIPMFISDCGSVALSRFSRAAFRGKVGAALFPPLFPMDEAWNLPLLATTETPLTVEKRNAMAKFSEANALNLSGIMPYRTFLSHLSKFAARSECPVGFLFDGKPERAHSRSAKQRQNKSSLKAKKGARGTSGGGLQFKKLLATTDAERAVFAGIATPHTTPRMTADVIAHSAAQATRIKAGIKRAQRALDRGDTWLPSTSQEYSFLFPKNTSFDAPVRRMMITASSISGTCYFPSKPIEQNAFMRAGIELEATALEHISKKYSFKMVKGVNKWTRALPSDPTFMAATLDGLTTTGIIVEVKFVHNFMDVITPAGATKKYELYLPQVQAQMHVFELQLALLVFYSIDADTGDMVSCEYWIRRDDAWLDRMKPIYALALATQRERYGFDPSAL